MLAAVLLSSACAFAQNDNNEPLKGDVNEDGTVDVADIVAVIDIMKNGGGTDEKVKYYWYVGQTDPSTMTKIEPIVDDTSSPGWRLIGTSLPTYSSSNKLYDATTSIELSEDTFVDVYIAIPNSSSAAIRDGAGNDGTTIGLCTKLSNTVTLNNVEYKIYKYNDTDLSFGYPIY